MDALNAPAMQLNLFDNADRIAYREGLEQKGPNRFVWRGRTDDDGIVTFGISDGVATGSVFLEGRTFEISADADGEYVIEELNPAAFPDEDAPLEPQEDVEPIEDLSPGMEADVLSSTAFADTTTSSLATPSSTSGPEIGVMVLWSAAARAAQGGTASMQSLVLAAVANANLAYGKSGVGARLKLVYSAETSFKETSSISNDLVAFRGSTDGRADGIHALRTKYGADVVTFIGNGYASRGSCGISFQMSALSAGFASSAYNIVDRTCAVSNLSYAHEVGHVQGLAHDPGAASKPGAYSYAYGYRDPGGLFRTVMSYGSGTRIPYFSNPSVYYSSKPTGKSTQNNAKALNNTAATVAAFRSTSSSTTTCSYSVSPTSLNFGSASGSATVTVSTSSTCSWSGSSPVSWATVGAGRTGSGTITVSVGSNGTTSRSTTVTIAGKSVQVSQTAGSSSSTTYTPVNRGCWKDGNPRDLPTRLANAPANDVTKALAICKASGAKYCGLQAGYAVFAGSSYGKYGSVSSCGSFGGNMVNRVYQMKP